MSELNRRIGTGIIWSTIETILNSFLSISIQFVLAKLLLPNDFGLVGLATVFIVILETLSDLGIGHALIQRKEKSLKTLFSTGFWTSLSWSFLLFICMIAFVAPLVSSFYDEPKLEKIIRALSLGILIGPWILIPKVSLTRNMQFKDIAFVNNISNFVAGLMSITAALYGFGVWSLVIYSVLKIMSTVPLYYVRYNWKVEFTWNYADFLNIFGFGSYTSITSLVNILTGRIDYLLIGKLIGTLSLGYYSFALLVTNVFRDKLVGVINKVIYPVYTQKQDDRRWILSMFLKVISVNVSVVYPVMLFTFLYSSHLLDLFFKDKWVESYDIIRIMTVAVCIQMIINSHTIMFRAIGKVKVELLLQFMKLALFYAPLLFFGSKYMGLKGAALGYTAATFLSVVCSLLFLRKIFDLELAALLRVIYKPMLFIVLIGGGISVLSSSLFWANSLVLYILCLVAYFRYFDRNIVRTIRQLFFNS